jgi:hypothetical protein
MFMTAGSGSSSRRAFFLKPFSKGYARRIIEGKYIVAMQVVQEPKRFKCYIFLLIDPVN